MGLLCFISSKSLVLSSCHLAHSRDTLPAVTPACLKPSGPRNLSRNLLLSLTVTRPILRHSLLERTTPPKNFPALNITQGHRSSKSRPRIRNRQLGRSNSSSNVLTEPLSSMSARPVMASNPITARLALSSLIVTDYNSCARTSPSTTKLPSISLNFKCSQRSKANVTKSCPWLLPEPCQRTTAVSYLSFPKLHLSGPALFSATPDPTLIITPFSSATLRSRRQIVPQPHPKSS